MKAGGRETAFEVLDALGIARLDERSGDLDGAVPLRVAQACVPLLEGNAFGFQVNLRCPIELRKSLGRVTAEIAPTHREAALAAHRSALPRLSAQGLVSRTWSAALAEGIVTVSRPVLGRTRVRLWTGLCVRPDAGVWLRVSATANRRNRLIEVEEYVIPDEGAFVPLFLDLALAPDAPDRVRLEGEIATIAPIAPGARIADATLAEAREIGEAHAAFYDAAYFAAKKGDPTRKYRKRLGHELPGEAKEGGISRVIACGPTAHAITSSARVAGAAKPQADGGVARIVFANLVPFEARFDGHTLAVEPDRRVLEAGARAVEQAFAATFGPSFLEANRGALWYLTKYFTPHPPGEPHFFVKPWAFVQTPPGWSCLLEGVHGDGYDILRGVVATDVFHATPAVFQVHRAGAPIVVPAGAPLLHVIPIPRRLIGAGYREAAFRDAEARA